MKFIHIVWMLFILLVFILFLGCDMNLVRRAVGDTQDAYTRLRNENNHD